MPGGAGRVMPSEGTTGAGIWQLHRSGSPFDREHLCRLVRGPQRLRTPDSAQGRRGGGRDHRPPGHPAPEPYPIGQGIGCPNGQSGCGRPSRSLTVR
jgi:hypothetical protein